MSDFLWGQRIPLRLNVLDLNTMRNPVPWYRDESPKIRCVKCGNTYLLGPGINDDPVYWAIWEKHKELCEGDGPTTLMKIEQAYKAGWRPLSSPSR